MEVAILMMMIYIYIFSFLLKYTVFVPLYTVSSISNENKHQ